MDCIYVEFGYPLRPFSLLVCGVVALGTWIGWLAV